ncbi:hypothetical protein PM082_015399 [Marasmius tenuissimus]|nr:hypothetical protein PM082_015399 [Marasmius tenuissimus]
MHDCTTEFEPTRTSLATKAETGVILSSALLRTSFIRTTVASAPWAHLSLHRHTVLELLGLSMERSTYGSTGIASSFRCIHRVETSRAYHPQSPRRGLHLNSTGAFESTEHPTPQAVVFFTMGVTQGAAYTMHVSG